TWRGWYTTQLAAAAVDRQAGRERPNRPIGIRTRAAIRNDSLGRVGRADCARGQRWTGRTKGERLLERANVAVYLTTHAALIANPGTASAGLIGRAVDRKRHRLRRAAIVRQRAE